MADVDTPSAAASGADVVRDAAGILRCSHTTGKLVLADGTTMDGFSFGSETSVNGEVVFTTGMVGYPEALTDPSYRGQILVLTFPLVGNYGVPDPNLKDEFGLAKYFESDDIHIAGLIVSDYSLEHSHWAAAQSLGQWLQSHNVPALFGLDTRMLAKKIREQGAILGKIEFAGQPVEFADPNDRNLVAEVSRKEPLVLNPGSRPRIACYDCGVKFNILRHLARTGAEVTVLPFDHLLNEPEGIHSADYFDGIFLSNGPGNPAMASITINTLRSLMRRMGMVVPSSNFGEEEAEPSAAVAAAPAAGDSRVAGRRARSRGESIAGWVKPIFGICLGNQLLALAAGASTYKMPYGNRGMNQPCIDMRTARCYITPQNHGFAVDSDSLPRSWRTFFLNANDHSNEGIIHTSLPVCSVQFHPEASGGPMDTQFLFKSFLSQVRGNPPAITTVDTSIYLSRSRLVRKVLLLGSGGLSIGQAGEFDYSGSQAIKALQEEGLEVVLINPNIATVQTSKGMADKVYFLPVTPRYVTEVIRKERPDSILVSMGGQTALNVGVALHDSGVLEEAGVRVLGTPIDAIKDTEDREVFARRLAEVDETVALSFPATSIEEAKQAAARIGYPVLVRAAFALGGLGSGFAEDEAALVKLANKAFSASDQILIDQDLRGWKEVEYEVVRDCNDNCVTVCNMENFDPLGVHTGDSIVVAPSQTLSNREYFMLRATALKVVRHLGVVGECNIQYALDPHSERYCIIEVNARLSRSSALASKATGYPLAYVATKLALGRDLVTLRNSVTKTTTACFEPALDYCVVKMPRWDLKKFSRVSNKIGSSMKSVGEVMAIGRKFEEALQKAVRMVNPALNGFESRFDVMPDDTPTDVQAPTPSAGEAAAAAGAESRSSPSPAAEHGYTDEELATRLRVPSDSRLFDVALALELGWGVERVFQLTRIDHWFLHKLQRVVDMAQTLRRVGELAAVPARGMRDLKEAGFSDRQIAAHVQTTEQAVRAARKAFGVVPVIKQIDTLAAEFPAQTNYLYMTYAGEEHDVKPSGEGVMVLGCGPYCIGSSVEFDWCAVSCVRTLRQAGTHTIVVNYNPETVSTDYDESDRLYFEELTLERVMDIYEFEAADGVIVSVGGQIPNTLAMPLHQEGVKVMGTSPVDIDRAEDRNKFSRLLDDHGIPQPSWVEATDNETIERFVQEHGLPVIVRPSYVLSGAAMRVVSTMEQLSACLRDAGEVSGDHPTVVSKFIVNAKEVEFDAVAKDGTILNYAISEHVENAGVHSGDATLVLPAQKLYVETIRKIKRISAVIARQLRISGPFNMQFMSKDNDVMVIECNLRASRTFPFISKTFDFNFISLATRAMAGLPARPGKFSLVDLDYVGVKAPQFSFTRLQGADPSLGVEMMSTGEVACFGSDVQEAFLKALVSTTFKLPSLPDRPNILVSIGHQGKTRLGDAIVELHSLGFTLFATPGTHEWMAEECGISDAVLLHKPSAGQAPSAVDALEGTLEAVGKIHLVINETEGESGRPDATDGYHMRRAAVDFGIPLISNAKCVELFASAMGRMMRREARNRGIQVPAADGVEASGNGAAAGGGAVADAMRSAAALSDDFCGAEGAPGVLAIKSMQDYYQLDHF